MCSLPSLVLTGALLAAAGYYLYVPFPEPASNPWQKSFVAVGFQIQKLLVEGFDLLGIAKPAHTMRKTITFMGSTVPYEPPNTVEVYETVIEGVDVMVFKPLSVQNGKLIPGLVYFHGGGWVLGSPALHRPLTTIISEEAEVIVVSVDYRLAPENPFPVPYEDCLKVTKYLLQNGAKFRIDKHMIGLAGDSSGAQLAMAVALNVSMETSEKLPPLRYLGLFAGPLQAFDFRLPSYMKYGEGPSWLTQKYMVGFWLDYLFGDRARTKEFMENMHTSSDLKVSEYGRRLSLDYLPSSFLKDIPVETSKNYGNETLANEIKGLILDYRVSPLLAPREALEKLPPTYIIASEFDVLRDDSFIAYERLKEAGVDIQHKYYRSEVHGFIWGVHKTEIAKEAILEFIAFCRRALKSSK